MPWVSRKELSFQEETTWKKTHMVKNLASIKKNLWQSSNIWFLLLFPFLRQEFKWNDSPVQCFKYYMEAFGTVYSRVDQVKFVEDSP